MRRQNHLVPVRKMRVHEIVQQRPLQPRAHAAVDPEARARQLGAARIVDQPQIRAEIHVVLGLKIKGARLAPVAQGLVVLLAARQKILVRQVGQPQHQRRVALLYLLDLLVVRLGFGGQLLHLGKQRRYVLPFPLVLRNQLVCLVRLRLHRLVPGNQRPALPVQLQNLLDLRARILALLGKPRDDFLRVFLDILNVQHTLSLSLLSVFLPSAAVRYAKMSCPASFFSSSSRSLSSSKDSSTIFLRGV